MNDYKMEFDSRIEEELEYLYATSIPIFLNGINSPIRYHNSQVEVWFEGVDMRNQLKLDEYDVS